MPKHEATRRNAGLTRKVGLARILSKLGYCSRSRAAALIRAGLVRVDGKTCWDPEIPVDPRRAQVAVDGKPVRPHEKVYLMMNKPRGVVTTAADEKGRWTVYDLLNGRLGAHAGSAQIGGTLPQGPWVAPVGRLDQASEGLLLFTNDSEWAARINAPETHLDKTYHVQISTVADGQFIGTLMQGMQVQGGEILRAKRARALRTGKKNCWLEIVLDEGRNRQIRRMMEALGIEVVRLIRVAIGPLQLGDLAKGQHRAFAAGEKKLLDRAMRGVS